MASILETKSVTKKFGGFTAVNDVSLTVDPGEIRFILGPNGAGKTTLFKQLLVFTLQMLEQFCIKVKILKS